MRPTTEERRKQLFSDIYDIIKGGKFEETAKKNIRRFLIGKNIELDSDRNIISLGKYFELGLTKDLKDRLLYEIETNIGVEHCKTLGGDWTEEYREGFVDGLKRSAEILGYIE